MKILKESFKEEVTARNIGDHVLFKWSDTSDSIKGVIKKYDELTNEYWIQPDGNPDGYVYMVKPSNIIDVVKD